MVDVNDFEQETTCEYKEEVYSVRDNGAVMRHPLVGKNARPLDNVWTFGKKNDSNGYMTIGSHRVHIIVATAFWGPRDSKIYVVDHKDTNRCNNRLENLRWLTKLENILLNEITRKKIEYYCGSVESFLEDPSQLQGLENVDKNFGWMRTVSKEEAENTLKNWKSLIEKPIVIPETSKPISDWIFGDSTPSPSTILPSEESHNIIQEDELYIPQQREENKRLKNDTKQQEAKERNKIKQNESNRLKEAIIALANNHGWTIEKNVVGNGWKADLVVNGPGSRIGIMLCRTTRGLDEKVVAMKAEGIKPCWLGSKHYDIRSQDLFPCFDVKHLDVELSKDQVVSLDMFLCAMMSNRLHVENYISVKKIKVRFFSTTCYLCNTEHYLYMINGVICDNFPSLASNDGFYNSRIHIDLFQPEIIESVKRFLSGHPNLNYPMGEIKKRLSKTRNENYMSFGCPKCDGLVGDFYLHNAILDWGYEEDDEYVHIVEIGEPGLKLEYKHWAIL